MQIQLQLMRKRVDRQKTEVLLNRQWEQYLEQGAAVDVHEFAVWFEKHKDDAWASRWIRSDSDSNRVRAGGDTFISAAQKRPDSNYDSSGDDTTSDDGDESKQQQEGGGSPLHLALEKKLPAAVSLALLARWRDAAKVSDSVGNYPLMIALKSNAAEAVLQPLYAAWPEVVATKNAEDETTLYLAMQKCLASSGGRSTCCDTRLCDVSSPSK